MKEESAELQMLVAELRMHGAVRKVQLMREARALYQKEHPDRVEGKAQAKGANEARQAKKEGRDVTAESAVTFVSDMAQRLGRSERSIESLIAWGRYIPDPVLAELDKRKVAGVGLLLGDLERAYRRAKGEPVDWEKLVTQHVEGPPPPVPNGHTLMAGPVQLMALDSKVILPALIEKGYAFDHISVDPPYGIKRRAASGEMADDREGSLWCVPMLAKLIKPGRALCLWTSSGVWAKWAKALVDEGLVIADIVTWDKMDAYAKSRTDEMMLVASKGSLPETFNDDIAKVWEMATRPNDDPLREHPSPKPVELMERVLARYSKPGEVVLDSFAGTGPVGVAAVRMGRAYVGYEAEPKYLRMAKGEIYNALIEAGEVRPRRAA